MAERSLLTLITNPWSLLSAPKRLQRMLLRLQKFDLDVSYRKNTKMYRADPLSRAYLPLVKQDIADTLEV